MVKKRKAKKDKILEEIKAELKDMKKHPEKYKTYTDLDELFKDLDS